MYELIEDEIIRYAKKMNVPLTDKQVREIAFDLVKSQRFNRLLEEMIQDLVEQHVGSEDRLLNKIKKTRQLLEQSWHKEN